LAARPPRIAFWGNFGTGNWGNECTLQAIVQNVRRSFPAAELSCICSEPADTEQRHGIRAFRIGSTRRRRTERQGRRLAAPLRVLRRLALELREWAEVFRLARRTDVLVMTGTGMLTDCSEGPFGLPYDMFRWSVAAKACRGRVAFASVGVEPIRHPLAKLFIRAALRLADYRSYRDRQSRDHLRRIGFASERDAVYPDLAFSLPEPITHGRRLGARERPVIAVGLYDYRSRGSGGGADAAAYRIYLETMAAFILWLLERGDTVRVVIGDLTYDEPVLEDLRASLDARGVARHRGRLEDEPARSVEDVMDQLAGADLVVASRFHNVLLALLLGKPVVSISYNEKNDALMKDMGLERYCQPIDGVDLERLIEQFRDLEHDAPRLRPALLDKAVEYRVALEQQYELIFGVAGVAEPRRRAGAPARPEDGRAGSSAAR